MILALYMSNPLPKITFIIVKKRHNTRFFIREPNPNIKMMNNVQPGSLTHHKNNLYSLYIV
jgi:hypothetical protein